MSKKSALELHIEAHKGKIPAFDPWYEGKQAALDGEQRLAPYSGVMGEEWYEGYDETVDEERTAHSV